MSSLDKFDMLADYIQFRDVCAFNVIMKEENRGVVNEEIKLAEHERFILGEIIDKIAEIDKLDEIEDNK